MKDQNNFTCYPIMCAMPRYPVVMKPVHYALAGIGIEEVMQAERSPFTFMTTLTKVRFESGIINYYASQYYENFKKTEDRLFDEKWFEIDEKMALSYYVSAPFRIFEQIEYDVCLFDSKQGVIPEEMDKIIYAWINTIGKD